MYNVHVYTCIYKIGAYMYIHVAWFAYTYTCIYICLECKISWVQVPPEAVYFSLKMTVLGELHCVVLYYFVSLLV